MSSPSFNIFWKLAAVLKNKLTQFYIRQDDAAISGIAHWKDNSRLGIGIGWGENQVIGCFIFVDGDRFIAVGGPRIGIFGNAHADFSVVDV